MIQPCPQANEALKTEHQPEDADAMFDRGIGFSTGRDVEQDLVAAHKWFNLAAMMGHEAALSSRGELAREMTSDQIAEAQRQARAWLWNRNAAAQSAATASAETVRPIYVRRRAQAMRSAMSFGRVCA